MTKIIYNKYYIELERELNIELNKKIDGETFEKLYR
jgi:hypothetical protein